MSASVVAICNSALTKVGANSIMSLADGTKEANICQLRFEDCMKAVLRMHPWHSAINRIILAPLTTQPAYGYQYQFQLPGDFVRLVSVNPETESDYKIEQSMVLGDFTELYLKYVAFPSDVTVLDDLLTEAIAAYLAWDIGYSITQNMELKKDLAEEKKQALTKAKIANAQELPSQEVEANYFLDARLGPVASNTSQRRNW